MAALGDVVAASCDMACAGGTFPFPALLSKVRFWGRSNSTSKKCGSPGCRGFREEEAQCEGNDHSRRRLWKEALCVDSSF